MSDTKFKRYTITSALPYANGPIHIGHLAGVYVPADIYARYLRNIGEDVVFIGGSDEHGVPITIKAKKEGITPQEVVDRYHTIIKKSFEDLGISFDIYSRTSAPIHHQTASDYFKKLYDKGAFIEQSTEQYFDEEQQQFLADRYITGTCPHCGNEKAYGDQCEKCGTSLNATDLINPVSALSGNVPIMKETKHWFLPLDKDEKWLKEWILESHKEDWKTNVYGQCKSWLDSGLHPRAVTRDLDWGVKVPVANAEGKVLYVWFDAPIGYISATKDWSAQTGKDWEPYWKSKDTKLVHFIGKDNIVFHCIIFPAMLKAEGSFILPENVPANEFLNLEGDKISTSRNWAVWLHEYLEDFPGKQDVLRYVLCSNAPETKDNEFTWKDFQAKNNNELVAILGNFVNRTLVLIQKYYEGSLPKRNELLDIDKQAIEDLSKFKASIGKSIESYRFREALAEAMNLARLGNKYLTENEPWKVVKEDPERVKTVLNICIQICANLSIAIEPFMPFSSAKLLEMIGVAKFKWEQLGAVDLIADNHKISTPTLLFEKIEDDAINNQLAKLENSRLQNIEEAAKLAKANPAKQNIQFDDFQKLDIRVGTILEAEKIAKTKNLLKLLVDTGFDKRVVVSGISEHYNPEDIIGQRVSILVNLEPRKIKGIESNGMILMAENITGELCFVSPTKDMKNGSEIR
ncbi:MAG: methionine--tRNA ligase [Bacteroidota bacterium]